MKTFILESNKQIGAPSSLTFAMLYPWTRDGADKFLLGHCEFFFLCLCVALRKIVFTQTTVCRSGRTRKRYERCERDGPTKLGTINNHFNLLLICLRREKKRAKWWDSTSPTSFRHTLFRKQRLGPLLRFIITTDCLQLYSFFFFVSCFFSELGQLLYCIQGSRVVFAN
jgi:hypothetical protein